MEKYRLIDSEEKLKEMCNILREKQVIAVDIECENNLHHYGVKIALIQVSTKKNNYIVDAVAIKDLSEMAKVFLDGSVTKIFHDVNFDFEVINHELGVIPKNVFDTQVAAVLLGKEDIGLGSLLNEYFGFEKEGKYQKADWTKRPIKDDMLSYAINDTSHSIELYEILAKELKEKGRYGWALEEMKHIEGKDYSHRGPDFFSLKGLRDLDDKQRAVLKRLYELREKLAKRVDRPVHFIMNNKMMKDMAMRPILSVERWRHLKRVHPIVKREAHLFVAEIKKGLKEKVKLPSRGQPKRYSHKQRGEVDRLNNLRESVSNKLGIKAHVVLCKDQIQRIVGDGDRSCLRDWQREVLGI